MATREQRTGARMWRRVLAAFAAVFAAATLGTLIDIVVHSRQSDPAQADAALVLGAAVVDTVPSPVFEERIRHAVALQKAGRVRVLVMTGGLGQGDRVSEAEAARDWSIARGVPPSAILVETQSRTTHENLVNARPLLAEHGLRRVLLVSDPLH